MERFLNPYDKETMKLAMLKHEQTFKEQVFELHRLYQIQKILMKNMRINKAYGHDHRVMLNEANYINEQRQKPQRTFDLAGPAEEYTRDEGRDGLFEIEDENDIELTLGPTRFRQRKQDRIPLNSDTGPSFSFSSNESNFIQRRSTNNRKRAESREELNGHDWGLIQMPNMNPSFLTEKNGYEVDDNMRQERLNRPPWLFQVLNLNMT